MPKRSNQPPFAIHCQIASGPNRRQVSLSEIKSEHTDGVIRRVLSRTSKNNALFRKPGKNEINAPFDFKGSFGAVANLLTAKRLRVNTNTVMQIAGWTPIRTAPEATTALLKIESVPRSVADPACGSGAILDVLRAAGHMVHGSDIVDYGWPLYRRARLSRRTG